MSPKTLLLHIATLQQTFTRNVTALQNADPQALHELRVGLRRLRTLLRPMAGHQSCLSLYQAASALFLLSNPLRDLEVLLADLETHGATKAAALRRRRLHSAQKALSRSDELKTLQEVWAQWQSTITVKKLPGPRRMKKRFQTAIARQQKRLLGCLQQDDVDLHKMRIHIKRLRYFLEARKAGRKSQAELLKCLCAAQSTLGEWHDITCHLDSAKTEKDLADYCCRWQCELDGLQAQLPSLLKPVRKALSAR